MANSELPSVIFSRKTDVDRNEARRLQREAAAGTLVRVAEGVYAPHGGRPVEEIVRSQWARILARYAPGSVLSGRSGLRRSVYRDRGADGRLSSVGWVWASDPKATIRRRLSLTGLEIRILPGTGPLEGDIPYLGIFLPSDARILLDNLRPSRSRQGPSRTAGQSVVEVEVENILKSVHEAGLKRLRAHAARIAPALGAEAECQRLADIIGAILGSRNVPLASPEVAARRRASNLYDPECLERLKALALTLERASLPDRPDPHTGRDERSCVSFMEAYFTNYIEGTRFQVEKARRIVFENEEPDGRPADGRDITQTFAQLATLGRSVPLAGTADEYIDELRERNRMLMDGRPEKRGGQFKTERNMAGNTVFVAPEHVEGTLREGFRILAGLSDPFARALFSHTLGVLVHPFDDGNGRTSRIMMTKELVSAGQCRVIVPTVYRSDYIGGLRALSQSGAPRAVPLVTALLRCQEVASLIVSDDLNETIRLWATTIAFLEDERDARLEMPNPTIEVQWRDGVPAPKSYWRILDMKALAEEDATSTFRFDV